VLLGLVVARLDNNRNAFFSFLTNYKLQDIVLCTYILTEENRSCFVLKRRIFKRDRMLATSRLERKRDI